VLIETSVFVQCLGGIISWNAFSVVPSIINNNPQKCAVPLLLLNACVLQWNCFFRVTKPDYSKKISTKKTRVEFFVHLCSDFSGIIGYNGFWAEPSVIEDNALKNVNNCLNTNIYSYLETSGGQSSNVYLNVVHFFNTTVN
jgi:hypothetical protein